jgi:Cu-Zn family superoxide dismutase
MRKALFIPALAAGVAGLTPLLVAQHKDDHHGDHSAPMSMVSSAVAVMTPTAGNSVSGTVRFEQTDRGVRVIANISGFAPNTEHGFHIHEFGDMRSTDGKSLGGHYNPHGRDHSLPPRVIRHAGDLGNLKADGSGNAKLDKVFHGLTIMGHESPVIGRGVVIHAKKDDGGQPTGNAGARASASHRDAVRAFLDLGSPQD